MSDNPSTGHNSGPIAADRLRSIVERHERLGAEKDALTSDQADIMKEAASAGFDKKAIRQILRLRKMKPEDMAEEDAILDTYKIALGMV